MCGWRWSDLTPRPPLHRWRGGILLVLSFLAGAATALADTPWAARYVEAKKAYKAGEFAACLGSARAAYDLAPEDRQADIAAVGARCAAGAGDRAAWETWSLVAGDRLGVDERAALEARLPPPPPITGALRVESEPAGAEVQVNGRRTGHHTPVTLTEVAPGRHAVLLTLDGYEAQPQEVGVVAGQTGVVSVRLRRVPTPVAAPTPASTPAPVAKKVSAPAVERPHPQPLSMNGEGSSGSVWVSGAVGAVVAKGTAYRGHAGVEGGAAWHLGWARLEPRLSGRRLGRLRGLPPRRQSQRRLPRRRRRRPGLSLLQLRDDARGPVFTDAGRAPRGP